MKRIMPIAGLLLLGACDKKERVEQSPATPVKVAAVDLYQPKTAARYSAAILPARQVSLSFRVSGYVTGIHRMGGRGLEPGDAVRGGTVLAQLREEDYQNTFRQSQSQLEAARESEVSAQAQLAQAQATEAKAAADFLRSKTLFESQSLIRPDLDATKAQLDVAKAQVRAAQAQINAAAAQVRNAEAAVAAARLAQSDTALIAPFSGTVVQRNVEVGMLAGPSLAAYTLADIGTVKAAFGVPDTVVVGVRPGVRLALTAEAAPGREFQGTVTSVAAVADAETRLFAVEVTIDNRGQMLKPGMIASLALGEATPAAPVAVVPVSAVLRDRSQPDSFAVMVVEGKVAKSRRVGLGATFGELLAVTSGVRQGEMVIRAGASAVNDGETVEVIP